MEVLSLYKIDMYTHLLTLCSYGGVYSMQVLTNNTKENEYSLRKKNI